MSLTFCLSTVKRVLYQVQFLNYWDVPLVVETFRSQIDALTYADMLSRDNIGRTYYVKEVEA
jgi:hypothetical protein